MVWWGRADVRVEDVPEPKLREPTDAVVRVTTSALCEADIHRYSTGRADLLPGEVLGHEVTGVVEEVGAGVRDLSPGDRVTGRPPGGQADYVLVPQADSAVLRVPQGPPDERFIYRADLLPASWHAVLACDVPPGGSLLVVGLGPVGDMAARLAHHDGTCRVIGVDVVPEHLRRARAQGIETIDAAGRESELRELVEASVGDRGPDAVLNATGGADLGGAVELVRAGGTESVPPTCGESLPMSTGPGCERLSRLFTGDDPLGLEAFASHRLPLLQAAEAYAMADGHPWQWGKVLFDPALAG